MIELPSIAIAALALVAGAWTAAAFWFSLRGRRADVGARAVLAGRARLAALLESGPAMALLVAPDGALEGGSDRLAGALGLDALPARWVGLFGEGAPFDANEAAELGALVADAAAGGSFSTTLRPAGSARILRLDGGPAPGGFPGRSALLW